MLDWCQRILRKKSARLTLSQRLREVTFKFAAIAKWHETPIVVSNRIEAPRSPPTNWILLMSRSDCWNLGSKTRLASARRSQDTKTRLHAPPAPKSSPKWSRKNRGTMPQAKARPAIIPYNGSQMLSSLCTELTNPWRNQIEFVFRMQTN